MILSLPIITLSAATLLAGIGLVLAFFPRIPAAVISFIAMVVGASGGMIAFGADQLWFWGIAALIAAGISYMVPAPPGRAPLYYTVGGALVGALIGLLLSTSAAVILASLGGAFLGFAAYSRTPAGRSAGFSITRIDALAALALPAVVDFSIIMLIFAQLLHI